MNINKTQLSDYKALRAVIPLQVSILLSRIELQNNQISANLAIKKTLKVDWMFMYTA